MTNETLKFTGWALSGQPHGSVPVDVERGLIHASQQQRFGDAGLELRVAEHATRAKRNARYCLRISRVRLACPKSDECDFRRTIEPEWKAHSPEAAVDVKLQIAKLEPSVDVLPSQ